MPTIIKWLYKFSVVISLLLLVATIFDCIIKNIYDAPQTCKISSPLIAFVVIVILGRLITECLLLFYDIRDQLKSINDKMQNK